MSRLDGADLGPMSDEGKTVTARRDRLGMSNKDLAKEAGVSRDTLSDLEAGTKDYRQTTLSKVVRALDKLEEEAGLGPIEDDPAARGLGEGLVEFTVEGDFGVRAVVKGPIRDIAALQAAAADLVRSIREQRTDGPHPEG